jgi:hypothetical protein
MTREIGLALADIGIDLERVLNFLKHTSRIASGGYEAQIIGLDVPSTSTASIIIYALGQAGAVSSDEMDRFVRELMQSCVVSANDEIVFTKLKPNSWTTSQAALALMSNEPTSSLIEGCLRGLIAKFHSPNGGWTYSGSIDQHIVYAIYPTIALVRGNRRYGRVFDDALTKTYAYLRTSAFETNLERLVALSLTRKIERALSFARSPDVEINYGKLVEAEFNRYSRVEHTIAAFGLRIFGPALYLLSRGLIAPDHPFALYCIKMLISSMNPDRASWPTPDLSPAAGVQCTFSTALALVTLFKWAIDCQARGLEAATLVGSSKSLGDIAIEVENYSMPKKIFVSYSSRDEAVATQIYTRLKQLGYDVIYAKFDLMVGDSIPGFVSKALEEMDYMVLCLSPTAVASKYVKDEIEGGKAREWEAEKKVILPALLESCNLPGLLKAKRYANFVGSFDSGMDDLLVALRR